SDSSSGLRYSGKMVRTSMRTSGLVLGLVAVAARKVEVLHLAVDREQAVRGVDDDATSLDVDHRDDLPHEGDESPRHVDLAKDERFLGGQVLERDVLRDRGAVGTLAAQAHQLVWVPGVLLLGGFHLDHELDSPQRLGSR